MRAPFEELNCDALLSALSAALTKERKNTMTIKVGDKLPDGKLSESAGWDDASNCPLRPADVMVAEATKGKKVAIFGIPGAFTPTCSAKHVPSYLANLDKLKAKGVSEVWCVAVNDGFVMQAWGRQEKATGKIRMLGDGSAAWTRALGLELDLTGGGLGLRMKRFSMLVDNGVVKQLNIEAPGKYEVSDADTLLRQLG
jgi:peroxiredoxin